jgi:hypothetical protein
MIMEGTMEPDLAQETVILDTKAGRQEITGWVIGDTWTGEGEQNVAGFMREKPFWSRNRVIRTPSHRYVSVREGYSRIYHTQPTRCTIARGEMRGKRMTVAQMNAELADLGFEPAQAWSCDRCEPRYPDEMTPGAVIRYEAPRVSTDVCDTVAQVIDRLTRHKRFTGVESSGLPQPIEELLDQCARNDPDWTDAEKPVIRIA